MSQMLIPVVRLFCKTSPLRPEFRVAALVSVVVLGGCSSLGDKLSGVGMPKFSVPANTISFKRKFYAGANVGASSLNPDTGSLNTSYTGSQSATGSQMRFGFDIHNMLSVELDSSIFGTATLNQAGTAEVNFTSYSASAIVYGLNPAAKRSRRQGWSGFGRLGIGLHKTSSNVTALDGSETNLVYGLGVEYGFANRLAVRLEGSSYGPDSSFAGLGLIYRFDSLKRLLPGRMVRVRGKDSAVLLGAALPKVYDPSARADQGPNAQPIGTVRLLASAHDLDADGVINESDKCSETEQRTTVDQSGCGIFDGTLAGVDFENGSSVLSHEAKASLDDFAIKLQAFPEVRIAIEGHTDNKGPADINNRVAQSRAEAVRNYLHNFGIAAMQLETRSAGASRAIADNTMPHGRQKNRRIEIVTLPNLSLEQYRKSTESVAEVAATDTVKHKQNKQNKSSMAKTMTNTMAKKIHHDDEPKLAAGREGIDLLPGVVEVPGLEIGGVLSGVEFETGTTVLSKESIKALGVVARELKKFPETRIAIVAHTNSKDTPQENLSLTLRQSKAVTRELARQGVNRRRMKALGFGDTLPLIQNLSERHKAVNRRIELRLVES